MENIKAACELSIQNLIAEFPEEIPEPLYSKKHIKRMNVLINKMRNDTYHHFTTKTVKVLLIAAILLSFLLVAFTVPSTRDFIIERYEKYSAYVLLQGHSSSLDSEIKFEYLPNGFELTEKNTGKSFSGEVYYCGEKYLVAEKHISKANVSFNTESYDYETVVCNNIKYTIFRSNSGSYGIVWNKNDNIYTLSGNLSENELLEIAKQIK